MAKKKHLAILKQGVKVWNAWRKKYPEIRADLSKANLHEANLAGLNLAEANLVGADLTGATLSRANLRQASLIMADLTGANLHEANLAGADLMWANLTGAFLAEAHLIMANLTGATLSGAFLIAADLQGANLTAADLQGANLELASLIGVGLVLTNLEKAKLDGCQIFGISAWGLKLEGASQSNLIITLPNEPAITVDTLEVAQFIYLLLNNQKIRDVIDTLTSKVVLILGRFTPKRKAILDAIREELRQHDYLPVLFDFAGPVSRDTHETITTLARLARFVIADITNPKSIPQELVSIVESLPSVPVQPLLKYGSRPWGMYGHIRRYPWVLPIVRYKQIGDLLASLDAKVIAPAEAKAKELEKW